MKMHAKGFMLLMVITLVIASCGKEDEPTNTDLLCREWAVLTIDGESLSEYFEFAVEMLYNFETNGDYSVTFKYSGSSLSVNGKWNWTNNEKTIHGELNYEGETETVELTVNKLTDDEFWFTSEGSVFKSVPK